MCAAAQFSSGKAVFCVKGRREQSLIMGLVVSGGGGGSRVPESTGVVNVKQVGHFFCEVCAVESSKKAGGDDISRGKKHRITARKLGMAAAKEKRHAERECCSQSPGLF